MLPLSSIPPGPSLDAAVSSTSAPQSRDAQPARPQPSSLDPGQRASAMLLELGNPSTTRDAHQLRALPQMFGWPQGLAILARHSGMAGPIRYGTALDQRVGAPSPILISQDPHGRWTAVDEPVKDGPSTSTSTSTSTSVEPALRAVLVAVGLRGFGIEPMVKMMLGLRSDEALPLAGEVLSRLNRRIAAAYERDDITPAHATNLTPARAPSSSVLMALLRPKRPAQSLLDDRFLAPKRACPAGAVGPQAPSDPAGPAREASPDRR